MKKIIWSSILIIILFLLCFPAIAYCQLTKLDSVDVAINTAESEAYDMNGKILRGLGFPAAMTSDTVFVQTCADTTGGGTWYDVYIVQASGARVRAHILVALSGLVYINPDWSAYLLRYIKVIPDDTELAARVIKIIR